MSPDDCIEMIARPFGVTPELQSFVLEWAGHKVRVTVESNSGSTTSLSITAYGRSFPKINLTREGGFERLGKQLRIAREAQLGEAIFDAKIYVDTTLTEEQVRQVLGAEPARRAVLELFREVHEVELRPNGAFVSTFAVDEIAHDPARLPPLLTQLVALVDAIPEHVSGLVAQQPKRYTPGGGLILAWALAFTIFVTAVSVVLPLARLFHPWLVTLLGVAAVIPITIVWALLVALLRRGGSRSFQETMVASVAVGSLLLPAGPLALTVLNTELDESTPVTHSLEIVNAQLRENEGTVELELEFRSPLDPADTLSETFAVQHVPRPGTRVTVVTRAGGLGFPYRTETSFTE
jgi:hypothetical protein